MDIDSWATLARLARDAKAELEARAPEAEADIDACENVLALAEGAVMDGTWTADPDVLAKWLHDAKQISVAVRNGREGDEFSEGDEFMYLRLDGADGADGAEQILTGWLAQVPQGVRRETQVKYGNDGAETETAFVTLRERPIRNHRARLHSEPYARPLRSHPNCGAPSVGNLGSDG